ncbi:nitroreductase family deazaflavin-dependent oxidoreductase [Mycolicibacterium sp. 018/SC-01/001]|uniref:nitroreductase family deazaflavin-dependent oxidoreductase n=1 Tax=Mycolicibacterium sp. 018/SC-01/001 TaxID=2592069 RepID=UPI00117D5220|nr:nitroreductase family deazaflavin-dependent oxidoreductase [Mycolicibacterium sp. 018/SC-01/001]TRW80932.1 nitroreductase family deazaflavin-dependent oxidoreductase [Mycolicibacterium sp. 018/SC-01/001]
MNIAQWVEQNVGIRLLMLHDALYQRTNGRVGHRIPLPGVPPSLLLHTVGAKTGTPRTTTLSYFPDGGHYYVVASKGGDPRAPGWYHNLKANPNVEINLGPRRLAVTATPVPADDPDYPRLWELVNRDNSNRYNGYQRRTSRKIPLVRLTPKA